MAVPITEAHLRLVNSIVIQVGSGFPAHVERDEMRGAGMLGLVEASQRFDPEVGVPFNRFAAQRIRGAMLDSIRGADWATRSVRRRARELEAVEAELTLARKGRPTEAAIAAAAGLTVDELATHRMLANRANPLSTEGVANTKVDGDLLLGDVLVDEDATVPGAAGERAELLRYVEAGIDCLNPDQRRVIVEHFLEGRTHMAIAADMGVTPARISQIAAKALAKLRAGIDAQYGVAPPVPTAVTDRRRANLASRQASFAAALKHRAHAA